MSQNLSQDKVSPIISVVMGSRSDWETMKFTTQILDEFKVSYESLVISAHRTPDHLFDYAEKAKGRGIRIIIAGAGGAAHLPGMLAAKTTLPILGVPIFSSSLQGLDSLYSIVQMPQGIPVATFAIGRAGASNAALFAIALLASTDPVLDERLNLFRHKQTSTVLETSFIKKTGE